MSKKMIAVALIVVCIASLGIVTNAAERGYTEFNVTSSNVSGQNPSDPWTPRRTKSNDGDTNFYVRVYTMSGSCSYIKFFAKKLTTGSQHVYNTPMYYYRTSIGNTVSQQYDATAPGGEPYCLYMEPAYGYANINSTGRFTP